MDDKISSEKVINDIKELNINKDNDEENNTVNSEKEINGDSSKLDSNLENKPGALEEIDDETLQNTEKSLSETDKETHRQKALELKTEGNDNFKSGSYLESINLYTKALNTCPWSYINDRSIFYCNRAAAKIKLEYQKSAIDDCTKAIELNSNYLKAYIRRAKLYEADDKLDESLKDFTRILELDPSNNEARAATVRLPPLINERNEKLKGEMLGKLKDLGNMVLKPFGLSTDNFKLDQDPKSGGYSVNFQQTRRS